MAKAGYIGINNIARKGTTIWHNHNNLGDFSLNNTIN